MVLEFERPAGKANGGVERGFVFRVFFMVKSQYYDLKNWFDCFVTGVSEQYRIKRWKEKRRIRSHPLAPVVLGKPGRELWGQSPRKQTARRPDLEFRRIRHSKNSRRFHHSSKSIDTSIIWIGPERILQHSFASCAMAWKTERFACCMSGI